MIGSTHFFDYAVYDNEGNLTGIRQDAPPEAKREYKRFLEAQEEAKKKGTKL